VSISARRHPKPLTTALGGGFGARWRSDTLRLTGGEYHHAGTAEDLRSVYWNLGSRLQVQTRETELTALLALLAAVLIVAGSSLSLLWFGRIA
jgi:Ca-activated chloride channel family protein